MTAAESSQQLTPEQMSVENTLSKIIAIYCLYPVREVVSRVDYFLPSFLSSCGQQRFAPSPLGARLPPDFGQAGTTPTNEVTPGFCEGEWSETPASGDAKDEPCFPLISKYRRKMCA